MGGTQGGRNSAVSGGSESDFKSLQKSIVSSEEEEKEMNQQVSEESPFSVLPKRVVIYDILSFHLHEVDPSKSIENSNPYDLFGRFTSDRFRHVFFLFSSLVIRWRLLKYVNVEKLVYLRIESPSQSLFNKLVRLSPKLGKLEKLVFHQESMTGNYENLFIEPHGFPCLKHLDLKIFNSSGKSWSEDNELWGRVKSLRMCSPSFNNANLLSKCTNVRRLSLKEFGLPSPRGTQGENIVVKMHDIDEIEMINSSEIQVVPGEKLKKMYCEGISTSVVLELYVKSSLLEVIEIYSSDDDDEEKGVYWLLNRRFNQLENLRVIKLSNLVTFECSDPDIHFLPKGIEELRISTCNNFKGVQIFSKEYPRLKVLHLSHLDSLECNPNNKWKCLNTLEVLTICRVRSINDEFFKENEFPCLKELSLSYMNENETICSGEDWNEFPKLQKMMVMSVYHFGDRFFQQQDLENLQELYFDGPGVKQGANWRFLKSLKFLRVHERSSFGKEFWKNPPFPKECRLKINFRYS